MTSRCIPSGLPEFLSDLQARGPAAGGSPVMSDAFAKPQTPVGGIGR